MTCLQCKDQALTLNPILSIKGHIGFCFKKPSGILRDKDYYYTCMYINTCSLLSIYECIHVWKAHLQKTDELIPRSKIEPFNPLHWEKVDALVYLWHYDTHESW